MRWCHGQIWTADLSLTKGVLYPWATWAKLFGAGEGNRTLTVSLEGFCSTIELHPHTHFFAPSKNFLVEGEGFEPSKLTQQIYSLPPFWPLGNPSKRERQFYWQLRFPSRFFFIYFFKISKLLLLNTIYLNWMIFSYLAISSSCVSGCSSSIKIQSTGHTCWHCGSS